MSTKKTDAREDDNREGRLPRRPDSLEETGQGGTWPSQADSGEDAGRGETWPSRRYPARGVLRVLGEPTIVFVTVCTDRRQSWLATNEIHDLIQDAWSNATAWLVGRYVIMPDHIHLFAAPGDADVDLIRWTRYWKSLVSRGLRDPNRKWQKSLWDTRLRSQESYAEKWDYVRHNPVRQGLVDEPDDWAYQGELHDLPW